MGNDNYNKLDVFNILLCLLLFSHKVDAAVQNELFRHLVVSVILPERVNERASLKSDVSLRRLNDPQICSLKFVP